MEVKPVPINVKIVNINMPFWALVGFMLKIVFASIPAIIILFIIGSVLGIVFGGFIAVFLKAIGAG